jgi:hypothetical protein
MYLSSAAISFPFYFQIERIEREGKANHTTMNKANPLSKISVMRRMELSNHRNFPILGTFKT